MLEDIMETTTQDYMDRIAVERQVKSDNMDLLRRSELELENAFSKYREEMENELQECISYIHSLDVREDLVERGTLSTVKGMDKWKEKLMAAQLKRDRAKRAYVRKQQAAMLQQTAHTSEALKYTEKLKELNELLKDKGETKINVILKDSNKNYSFELEKTRKFDFNLFSLIKNKEYVKKISF